ncbi:MAG: hypothetical protein GXX91_05175 [Verrucomicrobiaceae bacterium]|nr:hypothetical protein [Verrucomicrobiaceae bacterium]
MSHPKSLTSEQISQIQTWADEGDGLPEIQKKLRDEFALRITYLETRFLLEDLKIELKPEPVPEPEPEEAEPSPEEAEPAAGDAGAGDEGADGTGNADGEAGAASVTVSVDSVLRPDAIISGKVDFGGGNVTAWWLDQLGRLGMDPVESGFRPSEAQILAFQDELRAVIQKSGL